MSLIKALYIVAIGLLLAAFIGFGIETFYPTPKAPEYPTGMDYKEDGGPTAETQKKQEEFDKKQKDYEPIISKYNQNVSVIVIILSVILLAASLVGMSKLEVIGDALTLGGVFTLFYGIVRAIASEEAVFRFVAVGLALAIIVGLSYWRFLKGSKLFKIQ